MTVEIVKKEPDASVAKELVCCNCGATLRYVPNDVKTARYTYMGDSSGHNYVDCPNCGKQARIKSW